jgi:hypothetical protein
MMSLFLAVSMLFSSYGSFQSKKCAFRKAVDESPRLGNLFTTMNGGRVKEVRGIVLYPNGEVMEDAVVEVFESPLRLDVANYTYKDVERITNVERKAACRTAKSGRFCFKNLRPGKYLLRIGHLYDFQFSAVHVLVVVNPNGRRGSRSDLRIELPLSI